MDFLRVEKKWSWLECKVRMLMMMRVILLTEIRTIETMMMRTVIVLSWARGPQIRSVSALWSQWNYQFQTMSQCEVFQPGFKIMTWFTLFWTSQGLLLGEQRIALSQSDFLTAPGVDCDCIIFPWLMSPPLISRHSSVPAQLPTIMAPITHPQSAEWYWQIGSLASTEHCSQSFIDKIGLKATSLRQRRKETQEK